jgi:spore coat protein CotH
MRSRTIGLIWTITAIFLCLPELSFAQTQDDLFNGDILQEVRLYINPQDWETFHYTNFTCEDQELEALAGAVISPVPRVECHFAVEFHWIFQGKDITVPDVDLSSHGKGSRSNIKPSFKIEFSRYESQLNFLGLKYLVLRANTQDASEMHERLAMEFFRKLGMPAPREVHAKVYINDQYAGVYSLVEDVVDDEFLQRNFGETNGYLYSYEYTFPWDYHWLGEDGSNYSPLEYKPQNHDTDYQVGPLVEMVRTINNAPDSGYSAALAQYIDTNALFRELAAENYIGEQDGLVGDYLLNNHYIYRFANTVRHTYVPWDKSNTFWSLDRGVLHNMTSNVLYRRALADSPDLMAVYKNTMLQAADVAGGLGGWLDQEIQKIYQQIHQAVYDDTLKLCDETASGTLHPCSNDEFEADVARIQQFAQQRADQMRSQVAGAVAQGLLPQ